jgi:hypothetical protein
LCRIGAIEPCSFGNPFLEFGNHLWLERRGILRLWHPRAGGPFQFFDDQAVLRIARHPGVAALPAAEHVDEAAHLKLTLCLLRGVTREAVCHQHWANVFGERDRLAAHLRSLAAAGNFGEAVPRAVVIPLTIVRHTFIVRGSSLQSGVPSRGTCKILARLLEFVALIPLGVLRSIGHLEANPESNSSLLHHSPEIPIRAEFIRRLMVAVKKAGGVLLITADHGNAEQLIEYDTGKPLTSHTTNPVPFYFVVPQLHDVTLRSDGILADVAPTILQLLQIPQPADMTGRSLILDWN